MTVTIELDEATHTYRVGGQPFVSVTGEMSECGLTTETFFNEQGRERGHVVHVICAHLDLGRQIRLIEHQPEQTEDGVGVRGWLSASHRADYRGYVAAWENAKRDLGLNIQLIEHRVSDPTHGYAGTMDRLVYWKSRLTIIELKTGAIQPVTALQLVAYGNAYSPGQVFERIAVQLKPDGQFRVKHYELGEYTNDLHDFFSTLRVAAWIRKNR